MRTAASPVRLHNNGCTKRYAYGVSGGWAAFIDNPPNVAAPCVAITQTVLYARSPAGVVSLVSPYVGLTSLDAIADTGTVMYFVNGVRYLGTVASAPTVAISTNHLGRGAYRDGQWYVVMGASLFRVSPGGDDGGVPDAAGADAGTADSGADGAASDQSWGDGGDGADSGRSVSDGSIADNRDASQSNGNGLEAGAAAGAMSANEVEGKSSGCSASPSRAGHRELIRIALAAVAFLRRRRKTPSDVRS